MNSLKKDLDRLNDSISDLENQIEDARIVAESNIEEMKVKLTHIREDKRNFASKNDFESVQNCRRLEENLNFKIAAQWNQYSILKNDLVRLKKQRTDLENKIQLERDKIRRNTEILDQMNLVLKNYKNTQNLKQAAIDSGINPEHVAQWFEWGKNNLNKTYAYFYTEILAADEYFKDLEAQRLMSQMDCVVDAFRKTKSLKEASRIANVSFDTVMYWYEWGSRGFGQENTYFFGKIRDLM